MASSDDTIAALSEFIEPEEDRFLSCTDCGSAYPIDSMFEDERCYGCDGELAVRLMPLNQ